MNCLDMIVQTMSGDTTNEGSCQAVKLMFVDPSQCGTLPPPQLAA